MLVILPLPTSNSSDFWIGNFAKFTDKGFCVSIASGDLLAKSPVRMTDSKYWGFFGDAGNLCSYRLQIQANLSGKHFG